ncbi:hypothetical protein [Sphingomonas sp. GB1N7]|uniref:hypothetical protein n=1 Tax=Parasphingomonas caseinilytica TaxID=3096158 RepID=UPI002FCA28E0
MNEKGKWLRLGDRQVIRTEDLDDETLEAILNAEVPEEAKLFNYLMDDSEAG